MVRHESTKQLTTEEFKTPFYRKLSKENRWVKLCQVAPWDRFAEIYMMELTHPMKGNFR